MIVTSENFTSVLRQLEAQDILFLDCETNGLDPFKGNSLCGLGLGLANGNLFYFPFRHPQDNLSREQFDRVISVLNQASVLVGFNIKFDLKFLLKDGFVISNQELIDVLVLVRMTEPDRFARLGLTPTIDRSYGEHSGDYDRETKAILKKNKWTKDFSLCPQSILGPYCEKDVDWTRRLYFDKILEIYQTGQVKIWEAEKKLTKVLLSMEVRGVDLDLTYCTEKLEVLKIRQEKLSNLIFKDLGQEFNLGSNLQLGKAFNAVGIVSPVVSEAGNQSWDEIVLAGIDNPAAGRIREWRTLDKMRHTYLEPFLEGNGKLHTTFCNWGTITGRLSSREPNLQNIPRFMIPLDDIIMNESQRKELTNRIEAMLKARKGGQNVQVIGGSSLMSWGFTGDEHYDDTRKDLMSLRRCFVSRPGYTLVSFDYSQMEIRVFLSYLQDPKIFELMKQSNFDFHSHAAKLAFNVSEDHSDFKFYRQMAKAITFGVIYGIGLERLAMQLGTDKKKAGEYREKYFFGLPGARKFILDVNKKAKQRGFVFNRYGRRYWIPEGREYVSVNYLVQGTSADILTEGMFKVFNFLSSTDSHMLLQIHDEIICEIRTEHLLEQCKEIKRILEDNSLKIPLKIDIATGYPSWAHKKDLVLV